MFSRYFNLIVFIYFLDLCWDFGWDCEKRKDECYSYFYEVGYYCLKFCGICY